MSWPRLMRQVRKDRVFVSGHGFVEPGEVVLLRRAHENLIMAGWFEPADEPAAPKAPEKKLHEEPPRELDGDDPANEGEDQWSD